MTSLLRRRGSRTAPFALVALFVVVGTIAAFAYAINAWQVWGFAKHVWKLPLPLCFGAAVVADALSLAGLFATYLLKDAPKRVRAYAWFVFLGMTGLSIAAAESFAMWRRLDKVAQGKTQPGAMVAAAAIVVALALAVHLLIVASRHATSSPTSAGVDAAADAEPVAGVPIHAVPTGRQPGVYRAFGSDSDRAIYIGSTEHLASRIGSHKSASSWFPEVIRWTFEAYPTIDEARAVERALIDAEQPKYNRQHKNPIRVASPNRSLPAGTQVEAVPPSMNPADVRPPKMARRGQGNKSTPADRDRRTDVAERVISGQTSKRDAASETGVSVRAIEQWVAAYRRRSEESAVTFEQVTPNSEGSPFVPDPVEARPINGVKPQLTEEVTA